MNTKICETCKKEKSTLEFGKHKREKDGLRKRCKECRKKESKNYRDTHKEYIQEWKKDYYNSNKEEILNKSKEYYCDNKEAVKKRTSEYYHSNKGRYKRRVKERRANGEFFEIDRNHGAKRRACYNKTDITNEFLKELKEETGGVCSICGCKMTEENNSPNQYNLDHIFPLSKGGKHIKDNVRYICRLCNLSKGDSIPKTETMAR